MFEDQRMVEYKDIADYGVIGNTRTTALVSSGGHVDFLCYPRSDSPALLASLLDDKKGGHLRITPSEGDYKRKAFYYPDTNIHISQLSQKGFCEVWSFMPVSEQTVHDTLIQTIRGIKGKMDLSLEFRPRFNFGNTGYSTRKEGNKYYFTPEDKNLVPIVVATNIPVEWDGKDLVARFTVKPSDYFYIAVENAERIGLDLNRDEIDQLCEETISYWKSWVNEIRYKGRWRAMVTRSALTLKLLISRDFGSVVAAPTLGLPESLGGELNWDYRYAWVRDSSFVIQCLIELGLRKEAKGYMRWIEERLEKKEKEGPPLYTVYRLDGSLDLDETILKDYEGYKGSYPVRVGNEAVSQLQLDIYGELMDSVLNYDTHVEEISHSFWKHLSEVVDWVAANWQRPDNGIWEFRVVKEEFLYSRLMSWVCLDRALRLATRRAFPGNREQWINNRDAIYRDIFENFWNPDLKSFTQSKNSDLLDGSILMMPLCGFISPTDPLWISTLETLEKELIQDIFVYRFKTPSGSSDFRESSFSMCSFWYAECVAKSGDFLKGRYIFEKLLSYSNHLGLYSEELGIGGEMLGNFPQALTHLGLIGTASSLSRLFEENIHQHRMMNL